MKNLENYGVVSLGNKEMKETDGGTTCPTGNEGYEYAAPWALGWILGALGL